MGNSNTYIGNVLTGDALATIAVLERRVELQWAENVRLRSVVNEVADVKVRALSCIRLVRELNQEKALLQSHLDTRAGRRRSRII